MKSLWARNVNYQMNAFTWDLPHNVNERNDNNLKTCESARNIDTFNERLVVKMCIKFITNEDFSVTSWVFFNFRCVHNPQRYRRFVFYLIITNWELLVAVSIHKCWGFAKLITQRRLKSYVDTWCWGQFSFVYCICIRRFLLVRTFGYKVTYR